MSANTELDVPNGTTNLLGLGASASNDLTFTNLAYTPTAFTISGTNTLTIGTLNDLDSTQTLQITNGTAGTTATLVLSGGGDSVVGTDPADLFYVASGGTLNITSGTGTAAILGLSIQTAGNLDIAGSSTISAVINSSSLITKTGTGTLTLSGINSTMTGGFTVANGTLTATGSNGSVLGAANSSFTIGSGANNAVLNFSSTPTLTQNFTVAAGAGTRTISTSTTSTAGTIFSTSNTVTLNHDLILADTGTGGTGVLSLRGVISGSGGLVIDAANIGTVDLRGTNTFGGGTRINGGTVSIQNIGSNNASSAGTIGAITSGALGTSDVTLGVMGNATAATLSILGGVTELNNLNVTAGGVRTLSAGSATQNGSIYGGPIALAGDLTASSVAFTGTAAAADRLRLGSGGITGSGNLIVNNPNTSTATATREAIVLFGGATATAWTGNLILANGLTGINTATAVGAGNAVAISSNATLDYTNGTATDRTIAGINNATTAGAVGGATGGVIFSTSGANRSLTLGGSGTYSFAGVIQDAQNGTSTNSLTVNFSTTGASQTLSGASTFSGGTTIANGKLVLANVTGTSATGSGQVRLGSGTLGTPTNATLSGNGFSSGLLTAISGARLAPGVNTVDADGSGRTNFGSAGLLTVGTTGGTLLTSANLDFDLSSTGGNVSANDRIGTGAALTLGALTFNFNELNGSLATGTQYTLITGAASVSGFDVNNISTSFVSGQTYTPTYQLSGNDLTVSFGTVPEPSTWVGGVAGIAFLAWVRLRRVPTSRRWT